MDRCPRQGRARKGADHRSPRHDHGELQLVKRSGVQQRRFERRHIGGSRKEVCATLAGEAGAFHPLRRRVAMVPAMTAPVLHGIIAADARSR
jgi:hypothetical protein